LNGHTRVTHVYFFTGGDARFRIVYNEYLTVNNFLLEYHDLAQAWRIYGENSMRELFAKVPYKTLIDFLSKLKLGF
jgi:hypothetical protein